MDSRRRFFEQMMAAGGLATLLAERAQSQTPAPSNAINTTQYWHEYYGQATARGPVDSDLSVLYWNKEDKKGVRYTDQVEKSELLDHTGDVTIDVVMSHFQPGTDDAKIVKQYDSAQLRVECIQTKPFLNILAPSTWIALAALYPNTAGKLPSLQQLGFEQADPMSGTNKVVLPGGIGKFSVNVSSMAKESSLHKILRQGVQIGKIVSPLMGFPAISIPAAVAFTSIYSVLEEHASFIMKSPQMSAVATQTAVKDPALPANVLPIKTGDYIFVPRRHTDKLATKLANLEVNSGYLVDKTLPTTVPVETRADQSLPEITYLSLKVTVTPIDLSKVKTGGDTRGDSGSSDAAPAASGAKPKSGSAPTKTKKP
jgi:hypothetical protein